ncbi:trigger factor [Alkanindiges sp. WGS2144]|uniref:trigger factor n=1 Tax=Alkanindiges sp. WGS2144 TaxID=3366808 RepID=UPI003750C19D
MIVTTETVSGVARRLNVTVPSSRIDEQFEARLKRAAKNVKINGFRPGKVPMSRIRADYGPGIRQEVINDIIRDSVFEAIQQEKINAVGMPNIEKVDLNQDGLVYEATVEVYPEVSVQGLENIAIERKTTEVTDEDVDTMIDNLRKQRQTWAVTKGMAKKDMQVTFDFEGTVDGEKFEGGSAEDFKLVLGSGRMIPGFEDGIIGMKAGEEKVIDVTFPEDYQAENLRGKAAQFKINVKQVEKPKLPEVDAEFLNVFGVNEEEGLDKLKADVRKNMEREVKNSLRQQLKQAAFNAVLENNEVEVPAAMVTEEIGRQRQQMLQQFAQQFGGAQNFDQNMLPDELFREQAERSVKLGVLIGKVLEDAGLTVDQERVKAFIEESAQSYEDPQEVIDYFSNDKQQRAQIEAVVLEDQVVDHILQKAKVTDQAVSYQDLIKEQQAQRAAR